MERGVNDELFRPTGEEEEKDPVNPKGVGLKESEWAEVEEIADDLGVTYHALRVFFMRWAIKQYKAGNVEIPIRKEPKIDMD